MQEAFVKSEFLRWDKSREKHTLPREKERDAVRLLRTWRTDYAKTNLRKPLAGATRAKIVRDLQALHILLSRPYVQVVTPTLKNRRAWKKYAQQSGPYKKFAVERKSENAEVRMKRGKIVEFGAAGTYLKLYFDTDALLENEEGEFVGVDNEVARLWEEASEHRQPTGCKILVGGSALMGGNLLPDAEATAEKIKEAFNSGASGQAVQDYITGLEFLYGNAELHASLINKRKKKGSRRKQGKVLKNGRSG